MNLFVIELLTEENKREASINDNEYLPSSFVFEINRQKEKLLF